MGKKQKSKARLDKYYYLAKEHGFRSRAAFKLIQLNKKYHFLENSTCLIDLCAAPGGWLQVAAKYMPVSSIKIGVDLDPIKPIHGVTTFQADITSEKCRFLIKKEIKHFKADIVINDGAPNVGGTWAKDAYNQSELVLFAVKLATEFLKEGGWFVTKIFRSSDYNSLIYVLKQLFNKVEATKPQASRNESAEIFVVCSGYKAPASIDNKLLDPKFALKQLEDEDEMKMNAIKSIKAMFDQKVNRQGYSSNKLYNERSFAEFIESSNPYQFLTETNKIKPNTEMCKKYLNCMKCPLDWELYFEDIQLLGKKEVQQLIIWRNKIRSKMIKKEKVAEDVKEEKEEDMEHYEEKKMKEIDDELLHMEKQKKKKLEAEKKKKEKNDLRMKMSFINEQDKGEGANDVDFDQGLFDLIRKENIDIEDLEYKSGEENDKEEIPEQQVDQIDLSDLSEEDYINMMNEDIEENMKLFHEQKNDGKKKTKAQRRKEKEEKNEMIRNEIAERAEEMKKNKSYDDGIVFIKKNEDEDMDSVDGDIEDDNLEEDGIDADIDGDIDADMDYMDGEADKAGEKEVSDDDLDSVDDYLKDDAQIENPLRKKKNSLFDGKNDKLKGNGVNKLDNKEMDEEENNLSSDTDEEENKLIGKKTKRSKKTDNFDDILKDSDDDEGKYDMDEVAEIRAIAKKMLRKKDRLDILNKTYNRYAFSDLNQAPEWFADDEKQHNKPTKPVTKEEIMVEKEALKKLNDRMPKKILEAKARKKNKLAKKMTKIKKQAQVISNQEEINEFSKIKQIEKLYKKEMSKHKEKKKYMVSRSFKVNNRKDTRNIKHVDKRLKKDKRAQKARDKRKRRK